jgi:hypothetical protein
MIGKDDEVLERALGGSRYAIGDDEFVERAEEQLKRLRLQKVVLGDIERPRGVQLPVDQVEGRVAAEFGVSAGKLREHGLRVGLAKMVAIEMCCALCGQSQRAVARLYGYRTDGGVTRQRRVLRERMRADPALERRVSDLRRRLLSEV